MGKGSLYPSSLLLGRAQYGFHSGDRDPSLVNHEALERLKRDGTEISETNKLVWVGTVLGNTHTCTPDCSVRCFAHGGLSLKRKFERHYTRRRASTTSPPIEHGAANTLDKETVGKSCRPASSNSPLGSVSVSGSSFQRG